MIERSQAALKLGLLRGRQLPGGRPGCPAREANSCAPKSLILIGARS